MHKSYLYNSMNFCGTTSNNLDQREKKKKTGVVAPSPKPPRDLACHSPPQRWPLFGLLAPPMNFLHIFWTSCKWTHALVCAFFFLTLCVWNSSAGVPQTGLSCSLLCIFHGRNMSECVHSIIGGIGRVSAFGLLWVANLWMLWYIHILEWAAGWISVGFIPRTEWQGHRVGIREPGALGFLFVCVITHFSLNRWRN